MGAAIEVDCAAREPLLALWFAVMEPGTVVIGAGPAGLAVAAALRQRGIRCAVLERSGTVGAAWQGRYDSLRLHTVRWLSALPGARIPRRYGRWVRRDDFVEYLRTYAEQFQIRPEFGVDVERLDRCDGGWRIQTSAGARDAAVVIVATGYSRVPFTPAWPGRQDFNVPIIHSADYRSPDRYVGQRVLVIGAGNSASEIAVDLARAGVRVELSVRTAPNIVRRDTFGVPSQLLGIALKNAPERLMDPLSTVLRRLTVPNLDRFGLPAPSGDGFTQFLRTCTVPILDHGFVHEVRDGRILVVPAVKDLVWNDVQLVDGSTIRPDAVIYATGYRPGLWDMVGHLGVLDDSGTPLPREPGDATTAPDLYFVGITVQLAGLLREIGRDARAVSNRVGATAR